MNAKLIAALIVGLLAVGATACGSGPTGHDLPDAVVVTGTGSNSGAGSACPVDDPNCYEDGTEADTPSTTNPTTTAPGSGSVDTSSETDVGGYAPSTVGLEMTGDRTTAISEPLADGVYFSQDYTSDGDTVTFTLTQYFRCDSSTNVPEEPSVSCASGFGTLDEPTARVDLAPNAVVSIATGDLNDPTSADVTASEFTRLLSGEPPAADAPVGYMFSNFFVLVEVDNDTVVAVQQFYTS